MRVNSKDLVVVGMNFRNAGLDVRSRFALTTENIRKKFESLQGNSSAKFFILSTCNRTEIYSTNLNATAILELWSSFGNSLASTELQPHIFTKTGEDAVKHMFMVASGLDSQIIGDYEIVGQLKEAFNLAKSYKFTNGFIEKLLNTALQSSREIKKRTSISDGTTSVSYAAIKLLRQLSGENTPLNICLVGLGKIGTLTLKNLKSYMPQHNVTVVNRTEDHAALVAEKYKVGWSPVSCQRHVLKISDILIVATAADAAFISKTDIENSSIKYIFDLSVPCNVDRNVEELSGVKLYNVDELSEIVNTTIRERTNSIPMAEMILAEHLAEFATWEHRRTYCRPAPNRSSCPVELFMPASQVEKAA